VAIAVMFTAGLAGLVVGGSWLVRGASRLALGLGLSPLVVGLTVVAFGTSAPELAVSAGAVLSGRTGLAVGNVVGSNIFNVLFILGLSALITPLSVHRQVIRQEVPILIGAAALLIVLGLDGGFGARDGAILLGLLAAYTTFLVRQARAASTATAASTDASREPPSPRAGAWDDRLPLQLALIVAGLGLLVAGSEALVSSAVTLARALGVSDVVIGLTIVAAGTSLPEVATSVLAGLKGERDIAVGNVVGSNLFNIFGVLGVASVAAPLSGAGALPVPPDVARFDLWVMLAASAVCLPVFLTGREIARWEGALFLAYYAAYTTYLVLAAQRHAGAQALGDAMLGFVVPLTIVTLVVVLLRRQGHPA
jgi:cation:H+ antiporter